MNVDLNMNTLKEFHPLHAVGFGILGGFIGKRYGYDFYKTAGIIGVGSYAYMSTFGHSVPWNNNNNNKIEKESGIVPYTDPDKVKQQQPNTTSTQLLPADYYDGFDDRLASALKKGYSDLNDYVTQHKNDTNLADELYRDLGIQI